MSYLTVDDSKVLKVLYHEGSHGNRHDCMMCGANVGDKYNRVFFKCGDVRYTHTYCYYDFGAYEGSEDIWDSATD